MKKIIWIVAATLVVLGIVYAQTGGSWRFDRKVPVGQRELISKFRAKDHWTEIEVHRVIDWQTGNVIYVVTETQRTDTSPTVAVVPLQRNSY